MLRHMSGVTVLVPAHSVEDDCYINTPSLPVRSLPNGPDIINTRTAGKK